MGRVHSELRVYSREWFAAMADDVLVGHFQCAAVSVTDQLHHNFPQESAFFFKNQTSSLHASNKGCLHMAFKVDREMNQKGNLLPEHFIRTVHWENRRNYKKISETQQGAQSASSPNMMAYSLSHSPTCREYMHRYVESCGVVTCHGSNERSKVMEWGDNEAGMKAIVCNNAKEAVMLSTTVIGNYPKDPAKGCSEAGAPYQDEVFLLQYHSTPHNICVHGICIYLTCDNPFALI